MRRAPVAHRAQPNWQRLSRPFFKWLDKAYAVHDVHLTWLAVDPKWDPYRADPRFQALVARCGFTRTATTAPLTP